MVVCRNWAFDAAHEIALMQIRDDTRLPASDMEGVIKRHCPFQQNTAYVPVSAHPDLERAVIEAAIDWNRSVDWRMSEDSAERELGEALKALIAAREKQQ